MTGKIIPFPSANIHRTFPKLEDIRENIDNMRLTHIDEALEFINTLLMDHLIVGGFQFEFTDDNRYLKDLAMISEAISALLYKYHNMYHPLHGINEKMFIIGDEGIKWNADKRMSITVKLEDKKKKPE